MIRLPDGFDAAALFAEFFSLAAPFVSIAALIASFYLISRIFKKMP